MPWRPLRMRRFSSLLLFRSAPVGQTHQGFQPGQLKRAMCFQKAERACGPRCTLLALTQLHEREFQRDGSTVFAVEFEGGQRIALPDAARKAFGSRLGRSEERRVGKDRVRKCQSRGWPY